MAKSKYIQEIRAYFKGVHTERGYWDDYGEEVAERCDVDRMVVYQTAHGRSVNLDVADYLLDQLGAPDAVFPLDVPDLDPLALLAGGYMPQGWDALVGEKVGLKRGSVRRFISTIRNGGEPSKKSAAKIPAAMLVVARENREGAVAQRCGN